MYGERGKDYVEVHHIRPISSFEGSEQNIDPKTDLVTVCFNCHRMIHRKPDDIMSVENLKTIISGPPCY